MRAVVATLVLACVPALAGEAPPTRLLVVTWRDAGYLPALLRAVQSQGDAAGPTRPEVQVDVRYRDEDDNGPGWDEQAMARKLQPTLKNYRAVFVNTQFMARAIQMLDARIPIVFTGEADPVPLCLVDSLAHPGRNATGYTLSMPDEDLKPLEALVDAFPAVKQVVFLLDGGNVLTTSCSPDDPAWKDVPPPCTPGPHPLDPLVRSLFNQAPVIEGARHRGVSLRFWVMCTRADFAQVAGLARGAPDLGFLVPGHTLFLRAEKLLADQIAATHRPAVYGSHRFTKQGGLMSVEPIDQHDNHEAIEMLLQVLAGRSPATIPVQIPRGFTLEVNARAAAAQGLLPALTVLRRADAVTWPDADK